MPSVNKKKEPYCELVESAISSYEKRMNKRLNLSQPIKINNSIPFIVAHFAAACQFVKGRLIKYKSERNPCCPFQLDVCVAVGEPIGNESNDHEDDDDAADDDDDDDDDDDQKEDPDPDKFMDHIGDIEGKLKAN